MMAENLNIARVKDLSILNCPMCSNPLTIPAYQCLHAEVVVCCNCWPSRKSNCDTCSATNASNRCFVIEEILESVRATCPNEEFGCKESIPYTMLRKHAEECCRFNPCFCPLTNECDFGGTTAVDIYQHYVNAHRLDDPNYSFIFGTPKRVQVHESVGADIMHSLGLSVLFVLERYKTTDGVYLDLSYVAPLGSQLGPYAYRIARDDNLEKYENSQMKRFTQANVEPPTRSKCLFVPNCLFKSGRFTVVVCIWKVDII